MSFRCMLGSGGLVTLLVMVGGGLVGLGGGLVVSGSLVMGCFRHGVPIVIGRDLASRLEAATPPLAI